MLPVLIAELRSFNNNGRFIWFVGHPYSELALYSLTWLLPSLRLFCIGLYLRTFVYPYRWIMSMRTPLPALFRSIQQKALLYSRARSTMSEAKRSGVRSP